MNPALVQPSRPNSRFGFSLPVLTVGALALLATLMGSAFAKNLEVDSSANGYSAPALFNQANAYAHQGKTGLAIAAYERARLIAPGDPNIRANLDWVREHAGLPAVPESWLERAVSWASPDVFAYLGSAGLLLAGAGLLMARSLPSSRPFFGFAALVGIVLLGLCAGNAISTWQRSREAVILTSDAPARISPTTLSEVAFKLRAGELTEQLGRHADFVLIADDAGHSGWVRESDLVPLIPAPDHSLR